MAYISKDSKKKALSFRRELDKQINNLVTFPYKFRKSIYHNNENIRDMIFKGYTVSYVIDEEKETIAVFDIFKWIDKQLFTFIK